MASRITFICTITWNIYLYSNGYSSEPGFLPVGLTNIRSIDTKMTKVLSISQHHDKELIVYCGDDKHVYVYNYRKGVIEWTYTIDTESKCTRCAFIGRSDDVIVGNDDGNIFILYTANKKSIKISIGENSISSLATSPQGKFAAAIDPEGKISLISISEGRLLRTLKKDKMQPSDMCFLDDDTIISVGDGENGAQVDQWKCSDGKNIRSQTGKLNGSNWYVMISNDKKIIAVYSTLDSIITYDAKSLKINTMFLLTDRSIDRCMCIFPDGRHVALVSHDSIIKIMSLETGKYVCQEKSPGSCINTICASNDGKMIFVGDSNGKVYYWDIEYK